MNNLRQLVMTTEANLGINKPNSGKQKRDYKDTVKKLAKEMKKQNPFVDDKVYKSYENFEYFDDALLTKQATTHLLSWTKEKTHEFKTRIEINQRKRKANQEVDFSIN